MKITSIILIVLLSIVFPVLEKNRTQKLMNDNCIEIYLYKEYVMPENCFFIKDLYKYKPEIKFINKIKKSILVYDTINKEILHGSKFKLEKKLNTNQLLINNTIIKNFNLNSGVIELNKPLKLAQIPLNKDKYHLKQFFITINKKPICNGYLFNIIASANIKNSLFILCEIKNSIKFKFLKFNNKNKIVEINLQKDYPELYQAFKNSGRLIE